MSLIRFSVVESKAIESKALYEAYLPEFAYAIISSYLDEYTDEENVIELMRLYAGKVLFYYRIENITFANGRDVFIDGSPNIIEWIDIGQIYYVAWTNAEGKIHREDGPAIITYSRYHKICDKIWAINGFIENKNPEEPNVVIYNNEQKEMWCKRVPITLEDFDYSTGNNYADMFTLHRESFPAEIIYDENCCVKWKTSYINGRIHSINKTKPSTIGYYPSGKVLLEHWHQHNVKSRPHRLPAAVVYYESGKIQMESFYNWMGNLSRQIKYNESGTIISNIVMSHLMAMRRGTFVRGEYYIDEHTEDAVLSAHGLLGVEINANIRR